MEKQRPSAAAPMLACVFTVVAIFLAMYSGGYFWLVMGPANVSPGEVVRIYRYRWLASAFYPAGYLERLATGHRVVIVGGDGETLRP